MISALAHGTLPLIATKLSLWPRDNSLRRSLCLKRLIEISADSLVKSQIMDVKRSRPLKKNYVLEGESEIDSENLDPDPGDDDDQEEEEDAEGDNDETLLLPKHKIIGAKQANRTKLVTKNIASASQKYKQDRQDASDDDDDDDDDELSDLESELAEEGEQTMQIDDGDENEDVDSDDEHVDGSQMSAPDLNKLTRRQRARFDDGYSGHLMALPDEVQVKKHLTAEEHAMRRAEMARRRKNLSEKRNEEEKLETINKLLKKQAPKTNTRRRELNVAIVGVDTPDDTETQKPNPMFVRWVSNKDGNCIGVPEEWIDSPIGAIFKTNSEQEKKNE
ncbi:hypothetical protein OnM2_043076 [Erysiphe neolycopersici]|uniref:INO80 complex subunit B-like conserved region domain-containing protein n=1 Tax=Erysiphe neolycopersici TaxID=212602 RepID=A0A420HVA4_9PEZI|nr:hypothetical protein OnM2_043076 [Erysiphe neolycopersici]